MAVSKRDPKLVGLTDVLGALELGGNTPEANQEFALAGQKPDSLLSHSIDSSYILLGVTPEEFMADHGADVFKLSDLKAEFKKICSDYGDPLVKDAPSYALEFCAIVLYKIGPASRQVKAKTGDKSWILKFPYKKDNKLVMRTLFVSTYKSEGAVYTQPTIVNHKLAVSIKHASLLALDTLERLNAFALGANMPTMLLTPLSGAIFSRQDIGRLSTELGMTPFHVVSMINASCQSGGQHIEASSSAAAVCASIAATHNLHAKGKKALANSIVTKTIKQYVNAKKTFNEDHFVTLARHATGGIPAGMEIKTLLKMYNTCRTDEFRPRPPVEVKRGASATEIKAAKEDISVGYVTYDRPSPTGQGRDLYRLDNAIEQVRVWVN